MAGSTPIYGFPYPQSTDLVADYPTLGQELATDVETVMSTISGLKVITPTSIANSGGTASASGGQITFTGVTSVSLNGIFTSTYENYMIEMTGSGSLPGYGIQWRGRISGTDTTSNYAWNGIYATNLVGPSQAYQVGQSFGVLGNTGDNRHYLVAHIGSPQLNTYTSIIAQVVSGWTGAAYGGMQHNMHAGAAQFDGITIFVPSGTLTGIIRVYGLKNS